MGTPSWQPRGEISHNIRHILDFTGFGSEDWDCWLSFCDPLSGHCVGISATNYMVRIRKCVPSFGWPIRPEDFFPEFLVFQRFIPMVHKIVTTDQMPKGFKINSRQNTMILNNYISWWLNLFNNKKQKEQNKLNEDFN